MRLPLFPSYSSPTTWRSVEDKGTDWSLFWGENNYRWTPMMENGVGFSYIVGTQWYAVLGLPGRPLLWGHRLPLRPSTMVVVVVAAVHWSGITSGNPFPLCKRCWGEGKADVGWHSVEDSGSDWYLLWQENEYLWQPIITPMPPDGWIYQVHVTHNNGNPFTANAGPPTTNPPLLVYDSGGWGGIGYGGTSSAGPPSNLWPFGYGTPPMTGELDLGLSVEILPCIKATNTTLLIFSKI